MPQAEQLSTDWLVQVSSPVPFSLSNCEEERYIEALRLYYSKPDHIGSFPDWDQGVRVDETVVPLGLMLRHLREFAAPGIEVGPNLRDALSRHGMPLVDDSGIEKVSYFSHPVPHWSSEEVIQAMRKYYDEFDLLARPEIFIGLRSRLPEREETVDIDGREFPIGELLCSFNLTGIDPDHASPYLRQEFMAHGLPIALEDGRLCVCEELLQHTRWILAGLTEGAELSVRELDRKILEIGMQDVTVGARKLDIKCQLDSASWPVQHDKITAALTKAAEDPQGSATNRAALESLAISASDLRKATVQWALTQLVTAHDHSISAIEARVDSVRGIRRGQEEFVRCLDTVRTVDEEKWQQDERRRLVQTRPTTPDAQLAHAASLNSAAAHTYRERTNTPERHRSASRPPSPSQARGGR